MEQGEEIIKLGIIIKLLQVVEKFKSSNGPCRAEKAETCPPRKKPRGSSMSIRILETPQLEA